MIEKLATIEEGQRCRLGRHGWSVARLVYLSSDLEVMEVPLKNLCLSYIYENLSLRKMVSHMKSVKDCDLAFPIILDEDGDLMDGRHRIMKALLNGEETIKAVRFETNPSPCEIFESAS